MYWVSIRKDFDNPDMVELLATDRILMKDGGDRSVWRILLENKPEVIVKCRRANGVLEAIRRRFRRTAFNRELLGLKRLKSLNIPTNEPIAWMVGKDKIGGDTIEAIILSYVPGPTLLKVLSGPALTIAQEKLLCRAVARQLVKLHTNDFYNRDNKPSNLIVLHYPRSPQIAVIDAAGVRRVRPFEGDTFVHMLASLYIEPLGLGIHIRRSLCMRLIHAYADEIDAATPFAGRFTREYWMMVAEAIEKHGDPTPKVNPLSSPSK